MPTYFSLIAVARWIPLWLGNWFELKTLLQSNQVPTWTNHALTSQYCDKRKFTMWWQLIDTLSHAEMSCTKVDSKFCKNAPSGVNFCFLVLVSIMIPIQILFLKYLYEFLSFMTKEAFLEFLGFFLNSFAVFPLFYG